MSATRTHAEPAVVPAELVHDLGAAICRHLWSGDGGPLARARDVRSAVDGCPDGPRRAELERFVQRAGELPDAAWRDFALAMHPVQIRSKLWLIDELAAVRDPAGATIVVLGAWYGILPLLLNWRLRVALERMVCVDIDRAVCELAARTFGSLSGNVEYICADMRELDLAAFGEPASMVVVNTSCEHVRGLQAWWSRVPDGQLVVLQSNNLRACADHVNCVRSLTEFKGQVPMSDVLFEGAMHLTDEGLIGGPDLDRFMLIGHR